MNCVEPRYRYKFTVWLNTDKFTSFIIPLFCPTGVLINWVKNVPISYCQVSTWKVIIKPLKLSSQLADSVVDVDGVS